MTVRDPVEFTKELDNSRYQRVGNRVALDTGVSIEIAAAIYALLQADLSSATNGINLYPNPCATHHVVTISTVADTLEVLGSFSFHVDTTHVEWRLEYASARYTLSGNPVAGIMGAGIGIELKANDEGTWSISKAQSAKFIRQTASDCYIQVIELMRTPSGGC